MGPCASAAPSLLVSPLDEATAAQLDEIVATGDPDRYVSAFFAPASKRQALIALYAFHHEVGRVALTVREPMAGHIRLAWWREQIAAVYTGGTLQAPVPRALAEVARGHALPRDLFDAYLDARAFDLEELPFVDEAAMDRHADAVEGGLLCLAARVLGAGDGADAAAAFAGRAIAVGGHLHDLGAFAKLRRCRLPAAWLTEARLNAEDVFAVGEGAAVSGPVFGRMKAKIERELWRLSLARYARSATPAFAVATLARWPGGRRFDPLQPQPLPEWQRLLRLTNANFTWRY